MKIALLGSGSKGNATYIKTKRSAIMIDVGLSYKQIINRFSLITNECFYLDGILITHEHTDHISGIGTVLNVFDVPIYLSESTHYALNMGNFDKLRNKNISYIKPLEKIIFNDIIIIPIPLFHDARETIGFVLEAEDKRIVYITDTGYVHKDLYPIITNADLYVIEANHDPELLMNSQRRMDLKMRILGDKGHMSNQDSLSTICYVKGPKTKKIILAHISDECNTICAINQAIDEVFKDFNVLKSDYEIIIALQDEPTTLIEV